MTGVIYAIYSSDNQREESVEGQLRECRAFADNDSFIVIADDCILVHLRRLRQHRKHLGRESRTCVLYLPYVYSDITGNIEKLITSGTSVAGTIDPEYDNLGSSSSRILNYGIGGSDAFYNELTYTYYSSGGYTSGRVSEATSEIRKGANTSVLSASTCKYTYDANGNITEIRDANDVIQYRCTYDSLGQLIREDNRPLDQSVKYEYDSAGNIRYFYNYNGFTTGDLFGDFNDAAEFNYGDATWKDLVTEADGSLITYDAIGNPLTIGQASLTWRGRQLTNYALSLTKNVSYTYNADGIRTSKTYVNGSVATRHEYTLNGSQIVKEMVFTGNTKSYTLVYLYDEYGSPIGFRYRTLSYSANVFDGYFFEKNILTTD